MVNLFNTLLLYLSTGTEHICAPLFIKVTYIMIKGTIKEASILPDYH